MSSSLRYAIAAVMATAPVLAAAQGPGWFQECWDHDPMNPQYTNYGILPLENDLIGVAVGQGGTSRWGSDTGPCYAPARTLDAVGRFCFYVGNTGSVQSSFDDFMALTTGAPNDPVGDFTYAKILKNGDTNAESVLWGNSGLRVSYIGASKRYMINTWTDADVDAELQTKVLGDTVRMRWRLTNLQNDIQRLGLLFGSYCGQIGNGQDATGSEQANSVLPTWSHTGRRKGFDVPTNNYIGLITLPNGKPVRNERRYDITNPKFPKYCNVYFGQTDAYGIRFDNVAPPETPDATNADLFLIGNHGATQSPGLLWNNTIRLNVFGDATGLAEEADVFLDETSIVQRFPAQNVAAGGSRDIVHYIRQPWSTGDYDDPYAAVVDGPRLIQYDPAGVNGVKPNPFTVRAYLDNQYATLDKEVDMVNVRMTIFLPPGLSLAQGESQQKTIASIRANEISHVDWRVVHDGKTFGDLPYQVSFAPTPGPTKTLTGNVRVSAAPIMRLPAGATLITIPYTFKDTSLDDVLGMQAGVDYVAYRWDPEQSGYIPAITVERGAGYWLIPKSDLGYKALQGAELPKDQGSGGLLVSLRQGWNLIGNPYSFGVPVNQLIMVVEDSPKDSYTWTEAVLNNFVQSSLVSWERDDALPGGGSYVYTQSSDALIQPHKGYWIYVSTFNPIRLSWPAVFIEGMDGAGRRAEQTWAQNDRQWRLQLSARSTAGIDSQNYIGVVSDKKKLAELRLMKAPAAPSQPVELFIEESVDGKPMRMAQALTDRSTRKEWSVKVRARQAGDVTLTWPNMSTVPRNMRFRITDTVTGETRDLRAASGMTFRMTEAGVRNLKVTMEQGGSARPVIGNVLVTRPSRDVNAPVTVNYALSADALVTVRVLSNTGKEVFTVTRGRADSAGQNTVTWALRDNANRAVAPGVYRMEILAETPTGERVRRIVPVNVTR